MRRIKHRRPSLCSLTFWQIQTVYRVLIAISCFQCPNWFERMHPCLITSNNVCKLPLVKLWKRLEQFFRRLYAYLVLLICHLAEIVRTFKIHFKMKYNLNSDMPAAFAISRIVYLPSLSIIFLTLETLASPVAFTSRPDFVAPLTDAVPV